MLHIDALGGVAGDMFIAALLDLHPELRSPLQRAFGKAGLNEIVTIVASAHSDGILTGTRVDTWPSHGETPASEGDLHDAHPHRSYRGVREWLDAAPLEKGVRARAHDIFERLAEAEAAVHGISIDTVEFHEVGAWDSIADVVGAAWLIEALGARSWSSAPLPLGTGRVATAHGLLPIPAPAVALLLKGMPVVRDGIEGERVTPTGAAILSHLAPEFRPRPGIWSLAGIGTGFGHRKLEGLSNILRITALRAESSALLPGPAPDVTQTRDGTPLRAEELCVCTFEVDDQTGEDLAVALDRLREHPGVKDVIQVPALGKRGRLAAHVQLLCDESSLHGVLAEALTQTATLGVRWQRAQRLCLEREMDEVALPEGVVRVKRALRPGGVATVKAEHRDIAALYPDYASRMSARTRAETAKTGGLEPAPVHHSGEHEEQEGS